MEHYIKFDPSDSRERASVIKVLKAIDPSAFESSTNATGRQVGATSQDTRETMFQKIQDLKDKVDEINKEKNEFAKKNKELEETVNRHRKDAARSSEQIEQKEKKIEELKQKIEELQDVINSKENDNKVLENMIKEEAEKKKEELSKKDDEIRKTQDQANRKQRDLEDQIKALKEKLSDIIPDDVVDGQTIKFKIEEGNRLLQTGQQNAAYIAQVVSDGTVAYQFNVDDGPSRKACQEKDVMLMPFCDIEYDEGEGACVIRMVRFGKARLSGVVQKSIETGDIIEKAVIRITRN